MGKSYKAYRFRLYPNKQQEQQFARTFGCCRFLYNHMLADKIEFYRRTGGMLKNRPADYKKEFPWLKEVDSMALCNVQMHLESAYRKFFTEPKTGFPKFHSKHHGTASYTTNVINGNIRLVSGRLKLPKMAPLKIILHRDVPTKARLKSVTVTREASGKYYASLLYEQENCENQTVLPVRADKVLGIDFAMAGLAVFSDGTKAEYPMYYRRGEQRLARAQRKLSRCKKGSRNYEKQKRRVAICHEKIRNQRADFQNKLIYRIAVSYDAVCVENLDMKAMSRGLHFGKSVMDNANGRFRRRLEEKMAEMGKTFIKVERFFPSSKRCSCCGRVKAYLPLNERTYRCECGYVEDRDVNAAINLKMEGIRILGAV
jgi:putative transposase